LAAESLESPRQVAPLTIIAEALRRRETMRRCSPEKFREMLLAALTDQNDRQPSLSACRQPAYAITFCMMKDDRLDQTTSTERGIGQEGEKLARRLTELLANERSAKRDQVEFLRQLAERRNITEEEQDPFSYSLRRIGDDLLKIDEMEAYLNEISALFAAKVEDAPSWHDLAEEMLVAFRQAMAVANPGRDYGISVPGPAVRFIRACLKEVVDRDIAEATISQALRRRDATNRLDLNVTGRTH
jgi:hypothetical protein